MAKQQYMVHIQLVAIVADEATRERIEAEAKRLGAMASEAPAFGGLQVTRGVRDVTDDPATEIKALADAMRPLVVDEETAFSAASYIANVATAMGVTADVMAVKLDDATKAGGNGSLN